MAEHKETDIKLLRCISYSKVILYCHSCKRRFAVDVSCYRKLVP